MSLELPKSKVCEYDIDGNLVKETETAWSEETYEQLLLAVEFVQSVVDKPHAALKQRVGTASIAATAALAIEAGLRLL